jgi:hypothetical protein
MVECSRSVYSFYSSIPITSNSRLLPAWPAGNRRSATRNVAKGHSAACPTERNVRETLQAFVRLRRNGSSDAPKSQELASLSLLSRLRSIEPDALDVAALRHRSEAPPQLRFAYPISLSGADCTSEGDIIAEQFWGDIFAELPHPRKYT